MIQNGSVLRLADQAPAGFRGAGKRSGQPFWRT